MEEPTFENVLKMMKYRGYKTEGVKFQNPLFLKDDQETTKIYWMDKCGISNLKKIYSDKNTDRIIIVLNSITSYSKSAIKFEDSKIKIEILYKNKLLYNVMENIYTDKHVICSKEETDNVLKEFGATKEDFPKMLSTDPIGQYIGADVGDLVKIYRTNDDKEITSLYYRVIV